MLVLALETSTELGSVALLKNENLISRRQWRREKSHSELLTSQIEECFQESNETIEAVDRVAVAIGPGSFTGIRIAINAARTISYSLNKPVFATHSLRVLAEPARSQKLPIASLLNAHKNLIYSALMNFDSAGEVHYSVKPDALSVEELDRRIQTPHLCVGDAYSVWKDLLPTRLKENLVRDPTFDDEPNAAHLGRIAARVSAHELISWRELQPLYIRASEPEEKLKAGLLKDRSRINE